MKYALALNFMPQEVNMVMIRAARKRCLFVFDHTFHSLGISKERARELFMEMGCLLLNIDPVEEARGLIGVSTYKRGVSFLEAPQTIDCSGLVKYVYAQLGVHLPRRAIQQRRGRHAQPVRIECVEPGDLVFRSGTFNFYDPNDIDRKDGVGHVGIVSGAKKVIHATKRGVREESLNRFVRYMHTFRGAVRIHPHSNEESVTVEWDASLEIESSDDLFFHLQAELRRRR